MKFFLFVDAILKITKNVKIIKNELEKAHQIAILCTENNKYELNKLNNLQNIYDEAKNNINKETENVNKYRCNISIISKLIISTQKEITIIKTNIKKKKAKCYAILINCKVKLKVTYDKIKYQLNIIPNVKLTNCKRELYNIYRLMLFIYICTIFVELLLKLQIREFYCIG